MKRFFKKLFSRFSFVALTIILLFTLFVLVFAGGVYFAEEVAAYYINGVAAEWFRWGARVLLWLLVAATAVHAANRDMLPETKLPWVLCIVGLNFFGVAIYIVFSHTRATRKQRRRYGELSLQSEPYSKRNVSREELAFEMGSRADTSEALFRANRFALPYRNTKTEYFPSGESFANRLLGDLEDAKEYIFLEYFIIARGGLWNAVLDVLKRKVKEGVEVKVMYDDIGSMSRVHVRYDKTLKKAGIDAKKFLPFIPVVSNLHNNRDHRKIAVIDGKIGYTGGVNLADEYVNRGGRFGHWKDTAVRLEGEGVKAFALMFLRMFYLRGKRSADFSKYIPASYESFENEGFVQVYGDGPRPLYERQIGEEVYLNILNGAKRYVWITTPYLIIDYRMREALCMAAQRGVDVRIVTPHVPDKKIPFALTRSNYLVLIRSGVKIYEYTPGFMHAKSFLSDDEIGVIGTINLDYRSLMHHFEDAVLMYKTRALAGLKSDMEGVFSISALQTEADAERNVVSRTVCEIAKLFAPLF